MNYSRKNLFATALVSTSLVSMLTACGKDSDNSETTGRTLVVEVGDGQPGLRLLDESSEEKSNESVSEQEIQQCKDEFEGQIESWKIAGSENQIDIAPTTAFATKITGNQNTLNLVIKAKDGETSLVSFPGICLVLNGNQATVNATLNGVALTKFKVIARGNKSRVNVKLENGSTLPADAAAETNDAVTVTVAE